MADKKITALTDIGTGIGATDIWMVVDGIATTPTNKKMTVSKFTGYLPSYLGFSQAPDAITSASTVVDVTSAISTIATAAGALPLSLANGTSDGQIKFISMITDGGGTATITPTALLGYSTIALADVGDACTLLYLNSTSGWTVVSNQGCALA